MALMGSKDLFGQGSVKVVPCEEVCLTKKQAFFKNLGSLQKTIRTQFLFETPYGTRLYFFNFLE